MSSAEMSLISFSLFVFFFVFSCSADDDDDVIINPESGFPLLVFFSSPSSPEGEEDEDAHTMKLDDDDDELLLLFLNKNDALKEAIGGLFFSRDIRNREWVEEEEEEEEGRLLVARAVAATAVVGELLVANTDADIWLDSVCLVNARGSSELLFSLRANMWRTTSFMFTQKRWW